MPRSSSCSWKSRLLLLVTWPALMFSTVKVTAQTPEQFARRFAGFKFEFHAKVQDPAVFLATKKGDCDDFATLADSTLTENGYTTHLITVRMPGENHVVCYVEETHSYLDYNYRRGLHPSIPSDGELTHIAAQVAKSFGKPWLSAYEFNYHDDAKWLASRVVPNQTYIASVNDVSSVAAAGGKGR